MYFMLLFVEERRREAGVRKRDSKWGAKTGGGCLFSLC